MCSISVLRFFPQYHSTKTPYSSSTRRSYKKDKGTKPGIIQKSNAFRKSGSTGQKITVTSYMKGYILFHFSVFLRRPYLLKKSRLNVIWKRLMRDGMTTFIQRMRGADLFHRIMNSSAHSAILCIYTQIDWRGEKGGNEGLLVTCRTVFLYVEQPYTLGAMHISEKINISN